MGKKRKGGRPFGGNDAGAVKEDNAKLRINTFEDVPDSEDEFFIGRDKILLDEAPAAKRRRLAQEEEALLEPSDEEVLPVTDDEVEDEYDDDNKDVDADQDGDDVDAELGRVRTHSRSQGGLSKPVPDSDTEGAVGVAEDEDTFGWGDSRKDYYNADVNETEQDALEEEAEALRLQRKQREAMTEADFGLDDIDWHRTDNDELQLVAGKGRVVKEKLPTLQVTEQMSVEERMTILRTRYPEFEPLAKEFVDLQETYMRLKKRSRTSQAPGSQGHVDENRKLSMAVVTIKYRALAAYLSALSMYFVLFTQHARSSNGKATAISPEELQTHSIMDTLVECRDLWQRVSDFAEPEEPAVHMHGHTSKKQSPEPAVDMESKSEPVPAAENSIKKRKSKKSKAQRALEAQAAEAQRKRLARLQEVEASLAELSALTNPSKTASKLSKASQPDHDSGSDLGDATTLTPAEMAEKARRKKSLRFYTSQIAQKSNKRSAAGRDAGGDDDLPYRERWKEKQTRLQAEAERRGKKPALPGTALGEGSDDEESVTNAERLGGSRGIPPAQDDGDYYDFITSQAQKKKDEKAARAALASADKLQRVVDDEMVGEDGKRGISRAIEKNKGLTPKRKKDVRNPRVNKKRKYEDKKKKLGSIKPVWKGGEGRGGYGGELTGIKKGLVKGVRL